MRPTTVIPVLALSARAYLAGKPANVQEHVETLCLREVVWPLRYDGIVVAGISVKVPSGHGQLKWSGLSESGNELGNVCTQSSL